MSQAAAFGSREFLGLFVIEEELCGESGLSDFLSRMLHRCAEWFHARGASIFLETEGITGFALKCQTGPFAQIPEQTILSPGEGLAGAAIIHGKPKIIVGNYERPNVSMIGSSMILPLFETQRKGTKHTRGRCIGVLNLARGVDDPIFSDDDLALAETLGQQIALAVVNARLFAEAQHLNDMMRVLLAHVGVGLLSLNAQGAITHFNPELVMLFGSVPGSHEHIDSYIARSAGEGPVYVGDAANMALEGHKSRARLTIGQRIWQLSAAPLSSGGASISIEDVTELENEQKEQDRLKRFAEIGQMTAAIAHEIRNPLTGIRSAAQMIRSTPELGEEFAGIIEDESIKLSALCEEFLEFARPMRLEKHPVTLAGLVNHVCSRLQHEFDAAGVMLEIRSEPNQTELNLDGRRIQQVILNLVQNALQATKAGGKVTCTVDEAVLKVSDTGSGMDEETVSRLFLPFFTTKPKGTGLGLSMVRKIMDAHEGHIEVQSSPGKGTTFEIRFHQELHS